MRTFTLVVASIFVVLSAVPLRSQDRSGREPVSTVLRFSVADESGNPELTTLIRNSLRLELNLAGLQVEESSDPSIIVEGEYVRHGDTIELTLSVRIPGVEAPIYSSRKNERIGLQLDSLLQTEASAIVEVVRTRIGPTSSRETRAPETTVVGIQPEKSAEPSTADIMREKPLEPPLAETTTPPAGPAKIKKLALSADAGLFLSAGEAGRFFKTGYQPGVFIGRYLGPDLSLGFSTGIMYFRLEGYATEAQGLLIPAEASLRTSLSDGGRIGTWIDLGLGAALFLVDAGTGELLYKTVPVAETGLTLVFPFGGLKLFGRIGATVFLENLSVLYGFAPKIGILFR